MNNLKALSKIKGVHNPHALTTQNYEAKWSLRRWCLEILGFGFFVAGLLSVFILMWAI